VLHTRQDFVEEKLTLSDGRVLKYKQMIDSFSNPNGHMNTKTVDWLSAISSTINGGDGGLDLLELYCGNGNHTCALASKFKQILAIEIDQALVDAGGSNLASNSIDNARVIQAPSAKFCERVLRSRSFTHDGTAYDFGAVLVDPPRSGLDKATLQLVARYDHIMYISCNPDALLENMTSLSRSHTVRRFIALDHFPYTKHMECGVYLQRKPGVVNTK
jgi:tRNA (uracil-5-)-methyltransferase